MPGDEKQIMVKKVEKLVSTITNGQSRRIAQSTLIIRTRQVEAFSQITMMINDLILLQMLFLKEILILSFFKKFGSKKIIG